MLDIYKASAGSGKTFALTLEYFKIIFDTPPEYKNILAVTFTNKATEEMKSRIINELHYLAEGKPSSYSTFLKAECELTDEQLKYKAALLRTLLLHDYGRIAVTTIDRFFQRIIKTFTRELGIFPGYNVELDSDYVLTKAVDKVMQDIKNQPDLRSWVSELMSNSVEEGKSWSVKAKMAELGEELFRENYMLFDKAVLEKFNDKKFLGKYRDFLASVVQEYENRQTEIAGKALALIQESQLKIEDFKGGKNSCVSYFNKLANGNFDPPTKTVLKGLNGIENWVMENSSRKPDIEKIFPHLFPLLQEAVRYYETDYRRYVSAIQLRGNLYQLGILNDLYREVRNYCNEKGVLLLSDTTHLLNLLIADNDTSFLFEKCGSYFKHLMIDEFQDTSSMQWKNFYPLMVNSLAEGCRAMIVGDVKQSIYRWRNGDWRLLAYGVEQQFQKWGVENRILCENWRSGGEVVEFNNTFFEIAASVLTALYKNEVRATDKRLGVIEKAYEGLKQIPRKEKNGYVHISFGPDKKAEEGNKTIMDKVVATVRDIVQRKGQLKDIVVLVRNGKEGACIAAHLMEYNKVAEVPVRFISNDSLYISSSPYVQFIVAVLKYLTSPYDMVNKAMILYFYSAFVQEIHRDSLHEIFKKAGEEDLFGTLDAEFGSHAEQMMLYSLYETIETIIDKFSLKKKQEEIPYLIAFQDVIYEYEQNNSNSITLFLEWWEKEQGKRVLSTSEEVDAIRILTIHKSKGLEFKYVILPFCEWELDSVWPLRRIWCSNHEAGFNELEYAPLNYSSKLLHTVFKEDYLDEHLKAYIDNLNLLYVAFTRAKTELYVFPYTPSLNKDGSVSSGDIGAFIYGVVKQMPVQDSRGEQSETDFYWGEKQILATGTKKISQPLTLPHYPVWHPGDRISIKYRFKDYLDSEESKQHAISEGKLLHEIFKSVISAGDVEKAVRTACLSGLIQHHEFARYCTTVTGFLSTPQASEWFDPSWQVIAEKDILFPDGRKVRPDRVIFSNGQLRIIDYKFGQGEESRYVKQVRFYCQTMREMGYTDVKGYIWYVKLGKIVEV